MLVFGGMYVDFFGQLDSKRKWRRYFFVQFCFLKQSTRESIKYVDNDRDTFDLFLM